MRCEERCTMAEEGKKDMKVMLPTDISAGRSLDTRTSQPISRRAETAVREREGSPSPPFLGSGPISTVLPPGCLSTSVFDPRSSLCLFEALKVNQLTDPARGRTDREADFIENDALYYGSRTNGIVTRAQLMGWNAGHLNSVRQAPFRRSLHI
ncbi:hypothetical protein ACLOJK_014440 [Asimina triloba]